MNKLEVGMEFKNARELCTFIDINYDSNHPSRIYKRLACLCDYHRDNKEIHKIIIDNVFNEPDYSNYEKRNNNYKYNVSDVVPVTNGYVEILEQIRYTNKNRKSYLCKCCRCKHKYPQVEYNLVKGVGCPVCDNKKVVVGINDMWTTDPKTASLLLDETVGYKYTFRSGYKTNWKCPVCGEIIYDKAISNISNRGLICPYCSKTKSYPNRLMYNLLKYLNIEFKDEIVFEWSKLSDTFKRYDFYIPNYGIIEMMGRQHYAYCNFHKLSNRTLEDEIKNDDFKMNLALTNNITNYLQIDSRLSSIEYIKNSLLNSKFAQDYDLSNIDWNYLDELSQKNVFEYICSLWNDGITDKYEIMKLTGLSKSVVDKYLKKGNCYNLIEYDSKETGKIRFEKIQKTHYNKYAKPIYCKEDNSYYGSITICSKVLNNKYGKGFDRTYIIKKLKNIEGIRKPRKNYSFQYITREEFNTIKQQSPELAFGDFFILERNDQTA